MQLNRFVNREARQHHHDAEENCGSVSEALQAVVKILGRRSLSNAHVVREHRERIRSIARGEEYAAAPFTARTEIDQIENPVEDEEPGDREMPVARAGEPSAKSHPRWRRDILKRIPAILSAARAERWIRGENLQTAAGHD